MSNLRVGCDTKKNKELYDIYKQKVRECNFSDTEDAGGFWKLLLGTTNSLHFSDVAMHDSAKLMLEHYAEIKCQALKRELVEIEKIQACCLKNLDTGCDVFGKLQALDSVEDTQ